MLLFNFEKMMKIYLSEENKKATTILQLPLSSILKRVSLLGAVFTLRTGLCEEAGDDCHHQTIIIVSHQTCQQRDFHNSWRRHLCIIDGWL